MPNTAFELKPCIVLGIKQPLKLLYLPNIFLCSFDGLRVELPCIGHWLHVRDTKTESKLGWEEQESARLARNNSLLQSKMSKLMANMLARTGHLLKTQFHFKPSQYVVSVPFGEWALEDHRSEGEIFACVQFANPGVFWTLLCEFESKLSASTELEKQQRLAILAHGREQWTKHRLSTYREWAQKVCVVGGCVSTLVFLFFLYVH